jgi:pimeloyl-ACP methyl ester carboxylesterase
MYREVAFFLFLLTVLAPRDLIVSSSSSSSMSEIQEFKDQQILLPNGISAQVLSSLPKSESSNKPPLVFLHGGFHAAWCWTEKFFPYFVSLGYPVLAFSWRGTSGTPTREGVKNVKVEEHKEDLQGLLDQLTLILGPTFSKNKKPVLLSHSLGGALVMKYLEGCKKKPSDQFSGLITMCSIPPSGHSKMTMRVLWRSIFDAWKIVKGIPMKKAITDPLLCRQLFFGGKPRVLNHNGTIDNFGVSDEDVSRYQSYFARDSIVATDMSDLAENPPKTDGKGRAIFVSDYLPPALVIGAKDDFLVDFEANLETAKYYGLQKPVIVDSPHDVMLGRNWQNCASTIHHWIEETVVSNGNQ